MRRNTDRSGLQARRVGLALVYLGLTGGRIAFGQQNSAPVPAAAASSSGLASSSREVELETRVRLLEERLRRFEVSHSATAGGGGGGGAAVAGPPPGAPSGGSGRTTTGKASAGALAPGQGIPPVPAPSPRFNMPAPNRGDPTTAKFGPGFEWKTADDEYVLQFHNLTQIDFRGYEQGGQDPVRDTFAIPRQWFMFSGRLTKPFEYFVSTQVAFDSVLPLDIFGNIHYDDRLQFKIGRFKTPFTYEFYALPIQGLIQPERSLFFNNFGQNRDVGAMVWGQLFEKHLDYAVGVFNGTRNGFLDANDGKDVSAFLNWRPFLGEENTLFENLNIGGSVFAGDHTNTPSIPQTLRTAIATSGSQVIGVPFLSFNNNIVESGNMAFWDLHAAWYYRQLSLIGEWQGGEQGYAPSGQLDDRTRVPVQSYYLQAGYFLTGETAAFRGLVKPNRPFNPRHGQFGPGAIELTGRFNHLELGREVFDNRLTDPTLWSNRVDTTDLGFNWSLTQNVKFYFTWEHAIFGDPVRFAPGRNQLTSDLFLMRFQLFF